MNKYKREQKCSFCGKEPHEVEQLLAGPEAFICNECLEAGQLQLRMSRQGKPLGKHEARLSRPKEIKAFLDDYSEEGLKTNGCGLHTYVTALAYAEVIHKVFGVPLPEGKK